MLPVVEALAPHVRVSIDTRRAGVAEQAVAAGATLVNDVSASLWPVAAAAAGRGLGGHAHAGRAPDDAAGARVRRRGGRGAGVPRRAGGAGPGRRAWTRSGSTPGIGFGKTAAHNLALLRGLRSLVATGWPVLVGASRKTFLGLVTAEPGRAAAAGRRPAGGVAGRGGVGRRPGGGHGAGPRRAADGAGRAPAGWRSAGASMKGKWATGHRPPELLLDHQGPAGGQRAARGLRPGPPAHPPPGGDHLDPGAGLHPGGLAPRLAPQPPRLRRPGRGVGAHPLRAPRRPPGGAGRAVPQAADVAGGGRQDPRSTRRS